MAINGALALPFWHDEDWRYLLWAGAGEEAGPRVKPGVTALIGLPVERLNPSASAPPWYP